MNYFDQFLVLTYRRPRKAIGIALVAITVVGIILSFLYAIGLVQLIAIGLGKIYVGIFSFIWHSVLLWPDCGNPTGRRGDLDVCAGVGVIYLPLTIIATFAIMAAGAAAVIAFFVKFAPSRR